MDISVPRTYERDNRGLFSNPNGFNDKTEAEEVANKLSSHIAGKNILITGIAPEGIGATAAHAIASASPALIVLSARAESRAAPVAQAITSAYPSIRVELLAMDLGSFASVRSAAKKVTTPLDVVICNAGIMATPYGTTADGFEMQFGIMHLGHWLFTSLLLREGKIRDGGRIVNVTSDGHRLSDVRWDDPGFQNGKLYDVWKAYGQAKTAQMLSSLELARRLKLKHIESYSVHPGVIMTTNLGRHFTDELGASLKKQDAEVGYPNWDFRVKTPGAGAATHLVAAFDPSISKYNGGYLEDCTMCAPLKDWAADPAAAKRLWAMSEGMVREKFDF